MQFFTGGCMRNIPDLIKNCEFPTKEEFSSNFMETEDTFIIEEGDYWDFKAEFPFSYSDDYFYGLCRLVCAFYNTRGGFIIFGVNDKTREFYKTKVIPNTDKFKSSLSELCGYSPEIRIRRYEFSKEHAVIILLVPPKKRYDFILKFNKDKAGYKKGTIWVRDGHEVLIAEPRHFKMLFTEYSNTMSPSLADFETTRIEGYLPPTSSTINNFVGRTLTIEQLFNWIKTERHPVKYLSGKGGSGKTTIAYEFAKLVLDYGKQIYLKDGTNFDYVVFMTAKKKEFAGIHEGIKSVFYTDFFDYKSFLVAILTKISPEDSKTLEKYTESALEDKLSEALECFSLLIIVDDVDTLSTENTEFKSNSLLYIIARVSKITKLLYTIRQFPALAQADTIDVPGLEKNTEFPTFVSECARQFKVLSPNANEMQDIYEFSEGRPLVIEALLKLRGSTSSYDMVLSHAKTHQGSALLDYVFRREWDNITSKSRGQQVLVAVKEFGRPCTFDEIKAILEIDEALVSSAISIVKETFLVVGYDENNQVYNLSNLTRRFVTNASKGVVGYDTIKMRVKKYISSLKDKSPKIISLTQELRYLNKVNGIHVAEKKLKSVENQNMMADPHYRILRVWIYSQINETNYQDILKDVEYINNFNTDIPFFALIEYANYLKNKQKKNELEALKNYVIERNYDPQEKANIIFIFASHLFYVAIQNKEDDIELFFQLELQVVLLHLVAYYFNCKACSPFADESEKNARKTMKYLVEHRYSFKLHEKFNIFIANLANEKNIYLDPIYDFLSKYINSLASMLNQEDKHLKRSYHQITKNFKLLCDEKYWRGKETQLSFKQICG